MFGRSRGGPGASRGLGRLLPLLLLLLGGVAGRIHRLVLTGEKRADIHLNTFGFYANGSLEVNVSRLHLRLGSAKQEKPWVGFSLSRTRIREALSYPFSSLQGKESHNCTLEQNGAESRILFLVDVNQKRVQVRKLGEQKKLQIYSGLIPEVQNGGSDPKPANDSKAQAAANKGTEAQQGVPGKGPNAGSPQKKTEGEAKQQDSSHRVEDLVLALGNVNDSYNFSFHVVIGSEAEGLYNLNFHNCHNRAPANQMPYDITVMIREKNPDGYLSAAEIPLIKLYLVMSACFLAAATVWVYFLCQHKFSVFKIHWLMAALAYTKALSLLFHSINYYFINTEGHPIESLAVMYFVTHLLKGALLFITIALIGTGWAFIKYILSDKEKKLFVIVIPLQVLANVAYIIIESSEEGSSDYASWKQILFLVDLLCCGAILFPVVWSIRHLQEASSTDGKAATNLAKLKLFRHYYVMVVCYIYFSRVIAILLKFTVPFQWQWLYELLVEVSTLVFFILTGYKFRPASNNPYLQLPQEDEEVGEELQMNQVVTEAGVHEGLSKLKKSRVAREAV
ncbi:protein GPR108 isoform X1 [Dermochelys coriacea]|uniref:protein GPR108 isoform X1 n=1 Tax=Dermochelys coriacea TaxID=27794 RepID=UPI0018E89002|nr:protein GPR108 isoform X1 [Dermochelys coriacea]